jgi:O-antigen ligase
MQSTEEKEITPLPGIFLLGFPALVFSAFLTEVKFIPTIANNVGLFEMLGALLIGLVLLRPPARIAATPLIMLIGLLLAVAALSQINIAPTHLVPGFIQTSILLFLFLFLLALYNLALAYRLNPAYILRLILFSVMIVGPWILYQGFQFEDNLEAVGPFRNRSHMGIYMQTAFWLVMIYSFWPTKLKLKRSLCALAIALTLYAVAISGRRSVYISLIIGLIILVLALARAWRGRRATLALSAAFSIGFLTLLYTSGGQLLPRTEFFRARVGLIGSRLQAASSAASGTEVNSFFALQLRGVEMAFRDHPVLGIGWGGFAESTYSPTGHEIHSTPLRFLAETGIVGFCLYVLLLFYLLLRSAQLSIAMRKSPYSTSYLVMAIGIWSLCVSYLYNRHITERTFWLLLLVFLLLEAFAIGYQSALGRQRSLKPRPLSKPRLPAPVAPGMVAATAPHRQRS